MAPRADGLSVPAGHRAAAAARWRATRCAAARALPANARERGTSQAVELWSDGRWHAAGRVLEDLSIEYPRDALALQAGHQIDFFIGDSRMLRDRIARALPHWSRAMPGYHAVLGMHAFGLEESGDYARAESAGPPGGGAEPRDGWAQHAVAHVLEMQGRRRDGIAWMRPNAARLDARAASSPCTTGGTWRCSTWSATTSTRCWRCSTSRSLGDRLARWCST